jgi:hypothetical protein
MEITGLYPGKILKKETALPKPGNRDSIDERNHGNDSDGRNTAPESEKARVYPGVRCRELLWACKGGLRNG